MVHAMCDTYVALNIGQVTPKLGQDLTLKWYGAKPRCITMPCGT
jgi:hypothetical protein